MVIEIASPQNSVRNCESIHPSLPMFSPNLQSTMVNPNQDQSVTANHTRASLQALPMELILCIGRFLSGADIRSFKVTCHKFDVTYGMQTTTKDAAVFSKRLRKDYFRRLCGQEANCTTSNDYLTRAKRALKETLGLDNMLCSACMAAHPKRHFDPNEQAMRLFHGNA